MTSLDALLSKCQKFGDGQEYNFTRFSEPHGKFLVPDDKLDHFYKTYSKHITLNEKTPSLTERQKDLDVSPLLIDIDLKYPTGTVLEKHYDENVMKKLSASYFTFLAKYVDTSNVMCYVQERDSPYVDKDGFIKDGFHMILPDITCAPLLKEQARYFVMKDCKDLLLGLGSINCIDDIVDKAVISKNGWFVYGSSKAGASPYLITHVWDNNLDEVEIPASLFDAVKLLSIRKNVDTVKWLNGAKEQLESEAKKITRPRSGPPPRSSRSPSCSSHNVDVQFAIKLVKLLSPERADHYESWMNVGWALHNISDSLVSNFVNFSRLSEKFVEGHPEEEWSKMRQGQLGIGSLIKWAKEDSFIAARTLHAEYNMMDDKILTAVDYAVLIPQSVPFALIFKLLFPKEYVWPDCSGKRFYHFNGTYWKMHTAGGEIFQLLTNRVHPLFMAHASSFQSQLIDSDDVEKTASLNKRINAIHRAGNLLLSSGFRSQILKEIAVLFENPQFESHLDKKLDLLLFEDGVVDLRTKEFRKGRFDDLLTVSVGYNYPAESSGYEADIVNFFRQCHTDDDQRNYLLQEKAQRLSGHMHGQTLTLHTGSGGNAKSISFEFFKLVFGGYFRHASCLCPHK